MFYKVLEVQHLGLEIQLNFMFLKQEMLKLSQNVEELLSCGNNKRIERMIGKVDDDFFTEFVQYLQRVFGNLERLWMKFRQENGRFYMFEKHEAIIIQEGPTCLQPTNIKILGKRKVASLVDLYAFQDKVAKDPSLIDLLQAKFEALTLMEKATVLEKRVEEVKRFYYMKDQMQKIEDLERDISHIEAEEKAEISDTEF